MHIPTKKLENGFEIPMLGFGTWKMGGERTRDRQNDDSKDIQAIQYAISQGLTCIDTAEMYAG
jgi:diketogulonate reductase-like aldo/keto reductase